MRFFTLACCMLAFMLSSTSGSAAVNVENRCEDELFARKETSWIGITPELTKERHAWALKCHYISQVLVDMAESESMVWSFTDLTGRERIAPWNRLAPCGNYSKTTLCNQGCFAADQKILFGNDWLTLEEASKKDIGFTSMAPDSSLFSLKFQSDQKIKHYTAGIERHELAEFTLIEGKHVRVASNHAMVGASGELFPAREVILGTSLLTTDGPRSVTSVTYAHDTRRVWHIVPEAAGAKANIMVAQGVLTGSAQFQQKWADDMTRNLLRTSLEESTVEAFEED